MSEWTDTATLAAEMAAYALSASAKWEEIATACAEAVEQARAKLAEAVDLERRAPSRHDFEAYGLDDYIALVDAAMRALDDAAGTRHATGGATNSEPGPEPKAEGSNPKQVSS